MDKEAIILCGGMGKRLREHTELIPKAMVEIGGRPILWHIMKYYTCFGVNRFVLCTGYKAEQIEEYFSKPGLFGKPVEILYSDSGEKSTKARRILNAQKHIHGENFFVAYGDDLSDVDIKKTWEFHKTMGKTATLTAAPLTSNFGVLDMDEQGIITEFKEKPILDHWINGGFFVFNRRIFDYLKMEGELEEEIFDRLLQEKQICAYKHMGDWKCMNTFKDVEELNLIWNSGKAAWKCWND